MFRGFNEFGNKFYLFWIKMLIVKLYIGVRILGLWFECIKFFCGYLVWVVYGNL